MDELSDLAGAVEAFAEPVGYAVGTDRLIAPVAVLAAGDALFLDIGDLAIGAHFAVPTGDTPARQSGEAEESDETHKIPTIASASGVPTLVVAPRCWPTTEHHGYCGPGAVRSLDRRGAGVVSADRAWMTVTKRLDRVSKVVSRHADWMRDVFAVEGRLTMRFRPIS